MKRPPFPALAALALFTLAACKSDEPSYAGSYRTTWGSSVLTQEGRMVIGTYPRGTLRCRSEPPKLLCDWKEGAATGKATLTREPTHKTLQGTWGRDDSDTNGGAWLFTPIPK